MQNDHITQVAHIIQNDLIQKAIYLVILGKRVSAKFIHIIVLMPFAGS